jgi:hypothetical protein
MDRHTLEWVVADKLSQAAYGTTTYDALYILHMALHGPSSGSLAHVGDQVRYALQQAQACGCTDCQQAIQEYEWFLRELPAYDLP